MRDLMIDIETLGNRPGSVILSIGAVAFDADTGEIGEEFYAAIDPETASKVGLTTDISTMLWWMKQSEAAREAAFSGKRSINMALTELSIFVKWQEPSRVWAKPPSFDLVMLEAAFRACDQDIPWHFRVHRDCRTIFDITGTKQPEVGTAHNALDDAKAQALGVIEAYRKLREPSPQMHLEPSQAFAEWLNSGPAIAKAAGIEVEISAITSQGGTLKLSSAGYPETPPQQHVTDVLKNLVIACEANGLRNLPFVMDARNLIAALATEGK